MLDPAWVSAPAMSGGAFLLRWLNNLRAVYIMANEAEKALEILRWAKSPLLCAACSDVAVAVLLQCCCRAVADAVSVLLPSFRCAHPPLTRPATRSFAGTCGRPLLLTMSVEPTPCLQCMLTYHTRSPAHFKHWLPLTGTCGLHWRRSSSRQRSAMQHAASPESSPGASSSSRRRGSRTPLAAAVRAAAAARARRRGRC